MAGKMGLAEQGDFSETLVHKKRFTTFGRRGKQLKNSTEILIGCAERKF